MSRRLIVSIDGGGIRGIIPLIILKEIQSRISTDLFSVVNSWWGTSTGALISGALTVQKNSKFDVAVQNILDIYEFRSTNAIHPRGASLPSRALDQMIQANFGEDTFKGYQELNIIVSKQENNDLVVFNSENSCKLSDAIRASCAFPGLFPPVEIDGVSYVDGFLSAKNPANLAVEVELNNDSDFVVLSLGTGVMREVDAIELGVNKVHQDLKELSSQQEFDYFRFNPKLSFAVDSMQNTSPKNILNLRKDAMRFLDENEALVVQFADLFA